MTPIQSWFLLLAIFAVAWTVYRHFHRRSENHPMTGNDTWGYHSSKMHNGSETPINTISAPWLVKRLKERFSA